MTLSVAPGFKSMDTDFPRTSDTRWFIPVGSDDAGLLTTGLLYQITIRIAHSGLSVLFLAAPATFLLLLLPVL